MARPDGQELGTVSEIDGKIKVKWDEGATSYFRHGERGNIAITPSPSLAGIITELGTSRLL